MLVRWISRGVSIVIGPRVLITRTHAPVHLSLFFLKNVRSPHGGRSVYHAPDNGDVYAASRFAREASTKRDARSVQCVSVFAAASSARRRCASRPTLPGSLAGTFRVALSIIRFSLKIPLKSACFFVEQRGKEKSVTILYLFIQFIQERREICGEPTASFTVLLCRFRS